MMDLHKMRNEITSLIDDVKFHSDSLTPEHDLPILQLNIILAKMHKMVEETTILKHYLELEYSKQNEKVEKPVQDDTPKMEVQNSNEIHETENKIIDPPVEKAIAKEVKNKTELPDLNSAIGIYERYLFANELFNSSLEAFDEAITTLNEFESLEKARFYIEEGLKKEFNWEEENEQVEVFCNMIERRYNN